MFLFSLSQLNPHDSPLLEHNHWIGFQVRHIDFFAIFQDLWMLSGHQPTDVAEEEATVCIMRISISVRVFMMLTMITNPDVQTVLWREWDERKTKKCNEDWRFS